MRLGAIRLALGISLVSAALALTGCSATSSQGSDQSGGSRRSSIVNGEETTDFPATGMLLQQGQAFCTGTLIGPHTVLTAGHCMEGQSAGSFTFGIGSAQDQVEAELQVSAAVTHPQFDLQQLINDVAVVTLSDDAQVTPMALNQSMDQSWVGKVVTLVGFGVNDGPSQSGAGIKRRVDVTIDQVDTQSLHYTTQQGKTACNGDSGGPAFADQGGGQLVVAGITSYGDQNCQQYGVYTRVDAYLDFINEQLQNGGGGNNGGQGGAAGGGPNDPGNGQGGDPNDPGNGQGGDPNDPGNGQGGDPNDPGNGGQGGDPNDPGNGGQDSCNGIDYAGECDGNTVVWCDNGQLQQAQCQQCGWIEEEGFYDCLQ